jgi:hypothetical protein
MLDRTPQQPIDKPDEMATINEFLENLGWLMRQAEEDTSCSDSDFVEEVSDSESDDTDLSDTEENAVWVETHQVKLGKRRGPPSSTRKKSAPKRRKVTATSKPVKKEK